MDIWRLENRKFDLQRAFAFYRQYLLNKDCLPSLLTEMVPLMFKVLRLRFPTVDCTDDLVADLLEKSILLLRRRKKRKFKNAGSFFIFFTKTFYNTVRDSLRDEKYGSQQFDLDYGCTVYPAGSIRDFRDWYCSKLLSDILDVTYDRAISECALSVGVGRFNNNEAEVCAKFFRDMSGLKKKINPSIVGKAYGVAHSVVESLYAYCYFVWKESLDLVRDTEKSFSSDYNWFMSMESHEAI